MKLIEELDQARVSPPGALGFKKFLSKGLSLLGLILFLKNIFIRVFTEPNAFV